MQPCGGGHCCSTSMPSDSAEERRPVDSSGSSVFETLRFTLRLCSSKREIKKEWPLPPRSSSIAEKSRCERKARCTRTGAHVQVHTAETKYYELNTNEKLGQHEE